ncbi:MAG: dihydrofolate reductase [Oscillospiraceae bacterium]|nr:dihydrofolate reductase [Oscillospiraceae bacterium]
MNIIVVVNSDWGIGCEGKQAIILPEDRRFFRETTDGGTIIAGRKTYEDFPGPLPNRKNIILTRDKDFKPEGVIVKRSLEGVLEEIANEDKSDVFIVGGGEIYKLFLPLCDYAYVTKIEAAPKSDTYFPNLDSLPNWKIEEQSGIQTSETGVKYEIIIYKNTSHS